MANRTECNKQYYENNKPYPVRLGDLKNKLQQEAFEKDTSIHSVLKSIVQGYYEDEINPSSISERIKKAKEKMEAELARIKNSGTQLIQTHEKLLSYKGSDFLASLYKEMPELKPDIDLAVKSIKEIVEIRIEELRKELLSRNGVDLIIFSEKEIPLLKPDIDLAIKSVRNKIETKVERLKKELVEI